MPEANTIAFVISGIDWWQNGIEHMEHGVVITMLVPIFF